jgi:hypothetical protein
MDGNKPEGKYWKRIVDARRESDGRVKIGVTSEAQSSERPLWQKYEAVRNEVQDGTEARKKQFSDLVVDITHSEVEKAILLDRDGKERLATIRDTQPMTAVSEAGTIKGAMADQALDFLRRDDQMRQSFIDGIRQDEFRNVFVGLKDLEQEFVRGEITEQTAKEKIRTIIVAA